MKYFMLALFIVFSSMSVCAPAPTVLLLNSYHPQYPWTAKLTDGVVGALIHIVPDENIHVEYMDSRRFSAGKAYKEKLLQLLKYKYKFYEPDIIITSDDFAYNFMLENRQDIFPNIPIVFCGVNVFDASVLAGKKQITGILEGMEIEGNLKLIKQIQPDVDRVILLGDTTGFGLDMTSEARKLKSSWQDPSLQIEIWDTFSFEELHNNVSQLPHTTAILILAIHGDRLGQYFSYSNDLQALSDISSVPIYGMWGGMMLGNGLTGGLVNDPFEHGQQAGFMALAVLAGTSADDIEIQPKANFNPVFDYELLKRFKINFDLLPNNNVIMNKPVTVYETYKQEINGIIIFFIALILIINVLLFNIRKRIHIEKELDNLNKNLELKIKVRTQEINDRNHELEHAHKKMQQLANTDVLTGIGNRRAAQKEMDAYVKRARIDKAGVCVALLDIDFFKKINDHHGHQAGDDVLLDFAQVLKQALRPSDRVYRWGGEEFLILLPNTQLDFSNAVCNRILSHIRKFNFKQVGAVTASIGVASLNETDTVDTLVQRADEFLYKAKDAGRNQVVMN